MKRISTIFFQAAIVLIGIGVFAFMLWEPHVEGRNAHATVFEIYFKDPFLAYAYVSSILFFVSLFQAFKVLGNVRQDRTFSQANLKALRTIRNCSLALAALIIAAMVYLFIAVRGSDDIAGGVAMGLFLTLVSAGMATVAAVFERRFS